MHPDPLKIATEGALWGSVVAHGLLKDAVIVSDDAGQFNVGSHALCWVHAERLIHKLVGFNHRQRQACARMRPIESMDCGLRAGRPISPSTVR